jgi:hypothetical protein
MAAGAVGEMRRQRGGRGGGTAWSSVRPEAVFGRWSRATEADAMSGSARREAATRQHPGRGRRRRPRGGQKHGAESTIRTDTMCE